MTRKQALLQAINILAKKDQSCKEIAQKLQELIDENLMPIWTEQSIIDMIENYAIEHNGILPLSEELTTKNNLPSTTAIYHKFNISSIEEFYKKYFSNYKQKKNSSPYVNKDENYFIEIFKQNYDRIIAKTNAKTVNMRTYNNNRISGTPSIETIIKKLPCNSYNDLLILCGYKKKIGIIEPILNVSYNDDMQTDEDILSIIKLIKS